MTGIPKAPTISQVGHIVLEKIAAVAAFILPTPSIERAVRGLNAAVYELHRAEKASSARSSRAFAKGARLEQRMKAANEAGGKHIADVTRAARVRRKLTDLTA
jgi:hypothetical protein